MAQFTSDASGGASGEMKNGVTWREEESKASIELWKNYLSALRGCTRSTRFYDAIAAELNALFAVDELFTSKQVKQKIENLGKSPHTDLFTL